MKTEFNYCISLPSELKEGRTYPAIYAMHGRGSNEADIASLLKGLKDEFIIIGIRGTLTLNGGFEYFTIKSIGNPDEDSFDRAVEGLENFIDAISTAYPIDPSRQFLFGFSQGAILSMTLSLKMGSRIRGFAALNGYIPKYFKTHYAERSVMDTAVFIAHGEKDHIFPIQIGQENRDYFRERAQDVTYREYPIGHSISLEEKHEVLDWFRRQATQYEP